MSSPVNRDNPDSKTQAMLETMARMQIEHNEQVHPQWRTQGYPYYRAIWIECAELIDHFGWKWWKHQPGDLDQVRLELVDIWHFGLSDLLRLEVPLVEIAAAFAPLQAGQQPLQTAEAVPTTVSDSAADAFRDAVEAFAIATGADRSFSLPAFVAVLQRLPMSLDETFTLYVGKNVLNRFRQSNGYKTGEYRKLWNGREDNEHLIEAMAQLRCAPAQVPEVLYAMLQERYSASA